MRWCQSCCPLFNSPNTLIVSRKNGLASSTYTRSALAAQNGGKLMAGPGKWEVSPFNGSKFCRS